MATGVPTMIASMVLAVFSIYMLHKGAPEPDIYRFGFWMMIVNMSLTLLLWTLQWVTWKLEMKIEEKENKR